MSKNNDQFKGEVRLGKGTSINLSKAQEKPLDRVAIGLGWTNEKGAAKALDLDLTAFVLGDDGKVRDAGGMIFYGMDTIDGKLITPNGSIEHTGDDETGEDDVNDNGITDEEDEIINVKLSALHEGVKKILFVATVHYEPGEESDQTFANAEEAFVNVRDLDNNKVLADYTLEDDFQNFNGCRFAMLVRNPDSTWSLEAIGTGTLDGLAGLCGEVGIRAN